MLSSEGTMGLAHSECVTGTIELLNVSPELLNRLLVVAHSSLPVGLVVRRPMVKV